MPPEAPPTVNPRVHAYGPDARQHVLVYPTAGAVDTLAVLPGGGWAHGDPAGPFARAAVDFARGRGMHAAVLSHRLLPSAQPLAQAEDVARALGAFPQAFAPVAFGRVVLLAHSAGAHLAALVHVGALTGRIPALPALRASVLVDTAALDVPQLMQWPHAPLHDRAFGAEPARWIDVSPRHQIRQAGAPLLLVVSQARPGARLQARAFADEWRAAGGQADVQAVPQPHDGMASGLQDDGLLAVAIDRFLDRLDTLPAGVPSSSDMSDLAPLAPPAAP